MSTRDRFAKALDDLRDLGISVYVGLAGSTGVREWDVRDYTFRATCGGFGDRWAGTHVGSDEHGGARWDGDVLRYRDGGAPVTHLWFAFNHRLPEIGTALADTFRTHGFTVEWDGSPGHSVWVML